MYEVLLSQPNELRQGDILRAIAFPFFNLSSILQAKKLREVGDGSICFYLENFDGDEVRADRRSTYVLAAYPDVRYGMIVSQDCDIQRRKWISIAQVRELTDEDVRQGIGKDEFNRDPDLARARYLKYNIRNYYKVFYLREEDQAGFPKSVAQLSKQLTVKADDTECDYLLDRVLLRLTDYARRDLQYKISHYFGRYAGPDYYWLSKEEKRITGTN